MQARPATTSSSPPNNGPFTVILAGGEGVRLQSLTRAIHGHAVPKQFAQLTGNASMLQDTVARAHHVSDAKRIVVVVNQRHRELAEQQLEGFPGVQIIAQPFSAGTALGIGQALRAVLARDSDATVCFMPSDHHFEDPETFIEHVRSLAHSPHGDALTLVGVRADKPEPELGWIVPGEAIDTIDGLVLSRVQSFHEKPTGAQLKRLLERGALRNTFVMVGKAAAFWKALDDHLPEHAEALLFASRATAPWALAAVIQAYRTLPAASFSVEVLQASPSVQVFDIPPCGWSDWGTPEKVFASLKGKAEFYQLQERLTHGVRSLVPASLLAS